MKLECDKHADTFCVGYHDLILNEYYRPVTVYVYKPVLGSKTFCAVSDVMAYTDIMTGSTYHLVINKAIEITHLYHHLPFPIQCQVNCVTINNTPKLLINDPTPQHHAIVIDIEDYDADNDNLILPLSLKGVTA